ncbi:MAG: hypothetical protein N4A64_13390 [Marinisporobacter sp.]|nr:hypothetical protein [Marinisporobacter sp.]
MILDDITTENIKKIIGPIENEMQRKDSFEDASQFFCERIYDLFRENALLVRVFLSVPYQELPEQNKKFVNELLGAKSNLLKQNTQILSLVGTKGDLPEWGSRLNSKGHVGIPLISREFIHDIPMMNRVLQQIGVSFGDDIKNPSDNKSFSGLFYVKDSQSELDDLGRHVIASQEFVEKYGVKTVFGFGGAYLNNDNFFTAIIFLKKQVNMGPVENVALSATNFKIATKGYLTSRRIFND